MKRKSQTTACPKVKKKTRESTGLAIIGPYGTIWTDRIFNEPEHAKEYIAQFWGEGQPPDFTKWHVIPAHQVIKLSRLPAINLGDV